VYEAARNEFDERELAYLTLAVATINVWNRLSITFRRQPALRPVQQG
jgi:alkylhydroperoxidase family enzyme